MDRRQAILLLGAAALSTARPGRAFADKAKTMTIVAKVAGTAWFEALARGANKAAADFGIDVSVVGPDTLDPKRQAALIEGQIAKKVDVIGLVPVDPTATEPVLKRAKAAGIKIITEEGTGQASRDWDVELVDMRKFAESAMQALAAEMAEQGEYVIYVDSLTAPLHDQWADAAVSYQKAHFPRMKLAVGPFAGADEVTPAYRAILGILGSAPSLRGILGFGPDAIIGIGNAVRERQLQRKIALVGTVLPSRARLLIEDGIIRQGLYWNPIDAGYAFVAVASLLVDNQPIADGVVVPGLGHAAVDGKATLTFDRILRVDKDNLYGWIAQRL